MVEKTYRAKWSCPSNIALVKYWGKKSGQLPLNPSLSFSLQKSRTETSVELVKSTYPKINFSFEGEKSSFADRVIKFIDLLKIDHPWMLEYTFNIESENSFPHSAGIASSASSFGALALCLTDLSFQLQNKPSTGDDFYETASRLARMGSGSACRSIYKSYALWGRDKSIEGSTDCNAISFPTTFNSAFSGLRDAVLLVNSGAKKVSSSAGHQLMNEHPFKEARVLQAKQNLTGILQAMESGNLKTFFELAESEALTLHALMMSSMPSFLLLKPQSLQIIDKIRSFREQTSIPVGFTIDAGPNIHLLYFNEDRLQVRDFIQTELASLLEGGKWVDDRIGDGPLKLE